MTADTAGGMPYADFLNAVIDDGTEEVREAYRDERQASKREGALLGFSECRGKSPEELLELRDEARRMTLRKMREQAADYWYWRYRELQVEWVLNVLSAAEHAHGRRGHVVPTGRGLVKAVDILGLR